MGRLIESDESEDGEQTEKQESMPLFVTESCLFLKGVISEIEAFRVLPKEPQYAGPDICHKQYSGLQPMGTNILTLYERY